MGMNKRNYVGPFLRIETGEKGSRVDRCPFPDDCPNDVGQKCCSFCGKHLDNRYTIYTEPFPDPDEVIIKQYEESLITVLRLKRKGRYIILAISNRAFNDDEESEEEKGDDGSVREITGVDMTSEESQFAQEFAAEIGALHLAGAKISVHWGEIIYWN